MAYYMMSQIDLKRWSLGLIGHKVMGSIGNKDGQFKQLQINHVTKYVLIKLPETLVKITQQNTIRNISIDGFLSSLSLSFNFSHRHMHPPPHPPTYPHPHPHPHTRTQECLTIEALGSKGLLNWYSDNSLPLKNLKINEFLEGENFVFKST